MPQITIERSVKIKATPLKVWRAFTDPMYTKKHFGGEIASNWNVGSAYDWKTPDGKIRSHGILITVESEKILQYDLYRPSGPEHRGEPMVFSTITYELVQEGDIVTLTAREEFSSSITEQEFTLAGAAWFEALAKIKKIAEEE